MFIGVYGKGGVVGTESLDPEVLGAQSLMFWPDPTFMPKPSQDSVPASLVVSNYGGTLTKVVVVGILVSIKCFFTSIGHQYDLGLLNLVVAVSFFWIPCMDFLHFPYVIVPSY